MYLANLSDADRSIARAVRVVSILILSGLTVSGLWQFFFHESSTSWSRYELGSGRYLLPSASTGIAEVHAAFADLAGILTLFLIAWLSARVLYRVSWFGIAALLMVIASLYTGSLIRFNATIESETLITSSRGFTQFFTGSADGAVTDNFELGRWSLVFWTLLHLASIPVLVFSAFFTLKRADSRRVARKGKSQSWLDSLPDNPDRRR